MEPLAYAGTLSNGGGICPQLHVLCPPSASSCQVQPGMIAAEMEPFARCRSCPRLLSMCIQSKPGAMSGENCPPLSPHGTKTIRNDITVEESTYTGDGDFCVPNKEMLVQPTI